MEWVKCPTLRQLMVLELRLLKETKHSGNNDPKLELWAKALERIRAIYHGPLPDIEDDA